MCGFAGALRHGGLDPESVQRVAARMGDAIAHRGPDDAGIWSDNSAGLMMVHRRLSILDLSQSGHQPMVSASGRFVIAFNGEIYNHLALRKALESQGDNLPWRGHSDTETLLAAIARWGVRTTLKKAVGMFAFALWDREARRLVLARDRMGEKPLYFGWQGGVFLFGSELKALRAHPAFKGEIDRSVIPLFLRYNYIPAPHTIYLGIHKLKAGCLLEVGLDDGLDSAQPEPYWSLADAVAAGRVEPFRGDACEATDTLDRLLRDAVRSQMLADVPLGAFLSGGTDSSMVVALMQAQSARPVRTFTIGFAEEGYDEAPHAKAIARHLGTDHTELYVTPKEALGVIPKLPALYDEPFSDSSQIPTFLVSEMTRRHVTVSLSGDGGDELFGGYTRYARADRLWSSLQSLPGFVRAGISRSIRAIPISNWNRLISPISPLLPARVRNVGDKAHKVADLMAPASSMDFYRRFVTHWSNPDELVLAARGAEDVYAASNASRRGLEYCESMMLMDSLTYLPDDILVKVDRAAMGVSLETRVPMLDHRVVEFAWRLPLGMKIHGGQGKWILRQVLQKYVPRKLIERPKMGFGVPIDSWLRGPLRDWAECLLDETRLQREGFFNPAPIRTKWLEHLSGERNWQYHLWDVLMFEAWFEEYAQ